MWRSRLVRIVAMLAMFSVLKKGWRFFFPSSRDDDIGKYLADHRGTSRPTRYLRRKGTVTDIWGKCGWIDKYLCFPMSVVQSGLYLSVGDPVTYILDQTDDLPDRVIAVEECEPVNACNIFLAKNNALNFESDAVKHYYETLDSNNWSKKIFHGEIVCINGKIVKIQPYDIQCTLDDIKCEFVVEEGDLVLITTEISTNCYGSGEICHLDIEPSIKNDSGAITFLNEDGRKGIIEYEVYFSIEHCQLGFKPKLGERVAYKAVETTGYHCKWRAVSIEPGDDLQAEDDTTENELAMKKKNGISICGKMEFGPLPVGSTEELTLKVKNTGKKDRNLNYTQFRSSTFHSQLILKNPKLSDSILIKPGHSAKYVFVCKAKYLGVSSESFLFHFQDFNIEVIFTIQVTLSNEAKALIPEVKDKRTSAKKSYLYKNFNYSNALYGTKPVPKSRYVIDKSTSKYNLPPDLFKIVLGDPELCKNTKHAHLIEMALKFYPCLDSKLTTQNYKQRFHTLLYLEEIEDRVTHRRYDLHGVILRRADGYFILKLPRLLDEKICYGTHVILTQPWSEINTRKQVGFIHEIRDREILLRFHESFERTYNESQCDIMFQPPRTTYIRCHEAIDKAAINFKKSFLFPARIRERPPVLTFDTDKSKECQESNNLSLTEFQCDIDVNGFAIPMTDRKTTAKGKVKWFNKELNDLQKTAIINILEGRGRSIPYIIQGPPGTGKTITVIELILQLYHLFPSSRIAVATPSNSTSDLICQKLIRTGLFTPEHMVRILSHGRLASGNFTEEIAPFCTSIQEDFVVPMRRYCNKVRVLILNESLRLNERIVVGTCSALSVLREPFIEKGHFTHVIIDEAAQATEPESLIPINFLDEKTGQIILCGDTEQLGPVSINFMSERFGFTRSFMERINSLKPYTRKAEKYPSTNGFDPRCLTRLQMNYRSVPDILKLPNQLFYNSELIPTLSGSEGREAEIIRNFNASLENRESLAPMLFHGMRSLNGQEENSCSWYNPNELWQTVCYLKKLYALQLKPDDIGIITPYRKQVEKLRDLISELKMESPKIGSVEEFQGQERLIIIFSTVRSCIEPTGDRHKLIGFLSSPRRLNVALTRARALLIIIVCVLLKVYGFALHRASGEPNAEWTPFGWENPL